MSRENQSNSHDELLFLRYNRILQSISNEFKRLYFLTTGSPDVGDFLHRFLAQQIERFDVHRPMVLFVMGPPNSGKSYFTKNKLIALLEDYKNFLQARDKEFEYEYIHWDVEEIEMRVVIKCLQTFVKVNPEESRDEVLNSIVPNEQKFEKIRKLIDGVVDLEKYQNKEYERNSELFLELVGHSVKQKTLDWCRKVKKSSGQMRRVLIVELPGPSDFPIVDSSLSPYDSGWSLTYHYLSQMVADISSPVIGEDKGNAYVGFLGMVAGPSLLPYIKGRELLLDNNRHHRPNDEVLKVFGDTISRTGGTPEQIEPAWDASVELYSMNKRRVRKVPKDLEELLSLPEKWLRGLDPEFTTEHPELQYLDEQMRFIANLLEEPIDSVITYIGNMIAQGLLMEVIATYFSDQSCITLNNPDLDPKKVEVMKKFFRKSGYSARNNI